jgi:hypothetical protein
MSSSNEKMLVEDGTEVPNTYDEFQEFCSQVMEITEPSQINKEDPYSYCPPGLLSQN